MGKCSRRLFRCEFSTSHSFVVSKRFHIAFPGLPAKVGNYIFVKSQFCRMFERILLIKFHKSEVSIMCW